MKTVFAIIAVIIIAIAAVTTMMYSTASPGYQEKEVKVSNVEADTLVSVKK
ncbi:MULTISPECIES: hypothetical protein [unclassified Flammeovirga]|uniref:hypothetical protein n=1 Tax=unclassified Flammeovirga TaxID=2637820 RepID=UPI0012DFF2B4|nr:MULTISPECIES: hypothetical protein [unclassified Flammeovirga]MBD0403656.1 hypothetical protein [Flammeovirga sp. EKP202]